MNNALFLRNLHYIYLTLVAFLIHASSVAQTQSEKFVISWQKPATEINVENTDAIFFEEAYYPGREKIPFWTESFFHEKPIGEVLIEQCTFLPITDSEIKAIQTSSIAIPSAIEMIVHQVTSQKKTGVQIQIFPFVKDSITGIIRKLSSFQLQFIEQQKTGKELKSGLKYASNSVLSKGNWYKLAVTKTGIYSLGYNDLVAMGINPALLNLNKVGIFGRGGAMLPEANSEPRADDLPELAIEITGQADGVFNPADQILFYAQGPITWKYDSQRQFWDHTAHLYTDTICYFLTTDMGSGKRVVVKKNSTQPETDIVNAYDYYTVYEENNLNLLSSGRQWFAQIFDILLNKTVTFDIPALADGGEVKVKSVTAAKSFTTSAFDYSIGNQTWSAVHSPVSTYPNSPVATGANVLKSLKSISLPLKIDIRYTKTSSSSTGYLDFIDINTRCSLMFINGQLDFRDSRSYVPGHTALYRLANAAGKSQIWDVSDMLKVVSVEAIPEGNDLVFKLSSDTLRQFVAFDNTKLLKPYFVKKIQNQNLHAKAGVDLIIVAPQIFMSQARRLAEFHSNTSDLSVLVLDPESIYNEFSSGTIDITAIRDFMKLLYDKSSGVETPKYLLLFGDGSFDYKNKIASNTNFILAWQSPESFDPIKSLVSDDFYGILDDNEGISYYDAVDIGIGRLPVKSVSEASQAVDKIIHYATASSETLKDWRSMVAFVADDEDDEHVEYTEIMAESMERNNPEINLEKIYLDSFVQVSSPSGNRYPEVNKAISQRVEKGCIIMNYIGHGGEKGWAHEEVLTTNDINNWTNFNNLPVFVTATCEFSRFDDPARQSAGEMVLANPKGGGIGLFTTTRPTYGTPNFELNRKFFQYALSKPEGKRLTMGDIMLNSKRDKGSNENGRKYILLGDPALPIAFPSYNIITTQVNGHEANISYDTLKAYMEVTIKGIIADEQGKLVTDFNGTVFPSVFDKITVLKTLGNDGGNIFSFSVRKNLLYKGKVNVENGHFAFTFIVPKDIAYQYGEGKISYYASDGKRDASGYYSKIIVGGSAQSDASDKDGPVIKLYINNLHFQDGGMTDQNPKMIAVLSDESGINTIGNGIGHDITAILDGNTSEPFILNDFYESDVNTFKSGTIWFPFSMLSVGAHSLKVKVWDIFNNSSEAEIRFVVSSSEQLFIKNAHNFPNPFTESTDIVFEHNQQNVNFLIHAEIYSITGQLVSVIEQSSSQTGSVSVPLQWDGKSSNGRQLPSGMYIFKLTVRSSDGQFAQTSGKMIYKK